MKLLNSLLALCILCLSAANVGAKSQFDTALKINNDIITYYDIEEKKKLLDALGEKGDLEARAIEILTEERLKAQAARQMGIEMNEEAYFEAETNFAEQRNITIDQVYLVLDNRGIDIETFQSFLRNEIMWRDVVRARFTRKARPSEGDIDVAMNVLSSSTQESFLLAELAMPFAERGPEKTMALAKELSEQANKGASFEALARKYSRSPSARNGGRLPDYMPINRLPAQIATQLLTLRPGQVTKPLPLPNGVTIIKLVDIKEERGDAQANVVVSYGELNFPIANATQEELTRARRTALEVANKIDTCSDFTSVSADYGQRDVINQAALVSDLPEDIALSLANLDPGEKSIDVMRNNAVTLLMLCNRSIETQGAERGEIGSAIFNQRMNSLGDNYLEELKRNAAIQDLR